MKVLSKRGVSVATVALLLITACGGGSTTPTVTVIPGAPGAQIITAEVHGLTTSDSVQFYGQGADPDCTALTYSWDFETDGTADATAQSPSHTYAADGQYTCTLTVTDADGETATATCRVVIGTPSPSDPGVMLRCHSLLGATPYEVFFIAWGAEDSSAVTSYDWDFNGDGTFDSTTSTRTTTTTYAATGQMTPVVRANSADGSQATASLTLFICPADSLARVGGGLQIERDARTPMNSSVGSSQAYIASGTDMDGGGPTTYDWDFTDGVLGDAAGRLASSGPWPSPGTLGGFEVFCQATDNDGETSTATLAQPVVEAAPAADHPPFVQVRSCTLCASTGTAVQFLGAASDIEDGDTVTRSWDIDGDGAEDSTAANPTFVFTEPGIYTPTLSVTDGDGNTSTAYLTQIVDCCTAVSGTPPPPPPYFWCDCDELVIAHGGMGSIKIRCPVLTGGSTGPATAMVTKCNGQMGIGGDINCAQIIVGAPIPAAPPPPGTVLSVPITSTAVDGPPRTVCYTITIRLRGPSRVQQLKCRVFVVHQYLRCSMVPMGSAPNFTGVLQCDVQSPSGPIPPEIVAMELVSAEQNPQWAGSGVPPMGALPPNWFVVATLDRLRFEVDPQVGPTMQPGFNGQFQLQFESATPPTDLVANFYGADGSLIAREAIELP